MSWEEDDLGPGAGRRAWEEGLEGGVWEELEGGADRMQLARGNGEELGGSWEKAGRELGGSWGSPPSSLRRVRNEVRKGPRAQIRLKAPTSESK